MKTITVNYGEQQIKMAQGEALYLYKALGKALDGARSSGVDGDVLTIQARGETFTLQRNADSAQTDC